MLVIRRDFQLLVVIILLVIWAPGILVESHCCPTSKVNHHNSISNTNIDITKVNLSYHIYPTGRYNCHFRIEALGNNQTEAESGQCQFEIQSPQFENLRVMLAGREKNCTTIDKGNNTYSISFLTGMIPYHNFFTITGSFYGNFDSNMSGIYHYELGISWGTTIVGAQSTEITFDDDYSIIYVSPATDKTDSSFGEFQLYWNDLTTTGFSSTLEIHPRKTNDPVLDIGISSWNATGGESIVVSIRNVAEFTVTGNITTPSWIGTNVSSFTLVPNQRIIVKFVINRDVTIGMNDSIGIFSWQLWKPITIPVTVISAYSTATLPLLQALSLLSVVIIMGVMIYQKDKIFQFIRKNKKDSLKGDSNKYAPGESNPFQHNDINRNISEEQEANWFSIHSKWETILPENELKALEILYKQGQLNQRTIATEMAVSETTMSRIISRLETKRLIIREPFGMSKMIKLNKDRL